MQKRNEWQKKSYPHRVVLSVDQTLTTILSPLLNMMTKTYDFGNPDTSFSGVMGQRIVEGRASRFERGLCRALGWIFMEKGHCVSSYELDETGNTISKGENMKNLVFMMSLIAAIVLMSGCTNGDTSDDDVMHTTNTDDDTTTTTDDDTTSTMTDDDVTTTTSTDDDTTYRAAYDRNTTVLVGNAGGVDLVILYDVNMTEIAKGEHIDVELVAGDYTFTVFGSGAFYYATY